MEFINQPGPFNMDGNISKAFDDWKEEFEIYLIASGAISKEKAVLAGLTLHILGKETRELLKTLNLSKEDYSDKGVILQKLQDYCKPLKNITVERHKFNTRKQKEGESFMEY